MNPLPLLLAGLRRHLLTHLLFALLVATALALAVAVSVQERAIRQATARAAEPFPLLVGAAGSRTELLLAAVYARPAPLGLLPGSVLADLAASPRVRMAAPLAFGDSLGPHPVIGTSAALVARIARAGLRGRGFETEAEAVAGAATGLAPGDTFVPAHGLGPRADPAAHAGGTLTVVGVMAPTGTPWDRAILVPVEALWALHGLATGRDPAGPEAGRIGPPWAAAFTPGVAAVVVEPESAAAAFRLRQDWRSEATQAFTPAEALAELHRLLGDAASLLRLVARAALALVLVAILAGSAALVRLERRQVAVLRALGAPPLYVALAVWGRLALLLALGVLAGLGLGLLGALGLSAALGAETGLALRPALGVAELRLALGAFGAGALLALLPAVLVWAAPVADALRE